MKIEIIRAENWPEIRDSLPDPAFLLEQIVPMHGKTLLHGPPGSGKSAFAWGLANAVSLGVPYLNLQTRKANTLLLSLDMNKYELKYRWSNSFIPKFDIIPLQPFDCTKPGFCDSDLARQVREYVLGRGVEFVIVDALGQLHSGRSNKDDEVADDVDRVLDLWLPNTAILLIHHDKKARYGPNGEPLEPTNEDFLGSNKWRANMTSQLHVWPSGDHVSSLKHAKSQVSLVYEEKIKLYIDIYGRVELYDEQKMAVAIAKLDAAMSAPEIAGLDTVSKQIAAIAKREKVTERTVKRWRKAKRERSEAAATAAKISG